MHIGAGGVANDRDGVDVGDFQRQEGIRGVLDQFGGIDVRDDDGSVEGGVNLLHGLHRPLRTDSDDDPIRLHQILDSEAFAEEFGIADHIEIDACFAVTLDGFSHFGAGPDGDGALVHDHLVTGHRPRDFTGHFFDETQVHGPVSQRRRWNRDEDDVRLFHAPGSAGGEAQPSGGDVLFHQFLEARLVDRDASPFQEFNLGRVIIHANHVVPDLGEAGAGDEPDIAGSDDRELHGFLKGAAGRSRFRQGECGEVGGGLFRGRQFGMPGKQLSQVHPGFRAD